VTPATRQRPGARIKEIALHDHAEVARRTVAEDLSRILASPEVTRLIDELGATRHTGRPGYPLRSMIGMALAKSLYAIPCGRAPWRSSPSTRRSWP
jgi:hypothetical protein